MLRLENKNASTFKPAIEQLRKILLIEKIKNMIVFKILWAIDALASLVVLYFFVVGLGDGSVSSRNMAHGWQ